MKTVKLKPWQRHALVFAGFIALNGGLHRLAPKDWAMDDLNLLVNAVQSALATAAVAACLWAARRIRRKAKDKTNINH